MKKTLFCELSTFDWKAKKRKKKEGCTYEIQNDKLQFFVYMSKKWALFEKFKSKLRALPFCFWLNNSTNIHYCCLSWCNNCVICWSSLRYIQFSLTEDLISQTSDIFASFLSSNKVTFFKAFLERSEVKNF